jgi:hypothetical protein
MKRIGPTIDTDAWNYAKGQPCGGSWISLDKVCRKGGSGDTGESGNGAPSRADLPEPWQKAAGFFEAKYNERLKNQLSPFGVEVPPARQKKLEPYATLTPDERAAVHMYFTSAGSKDKPNPYSLYQDLNAKLRNNTQPPEEKKDAVNFVEHHLRKALDRLPDTSGEFHRRVSGVGAEMLQDLKPGDVIVDRGFGSYSGRDGGPSLDAFTRSGQVNAHIKVNAKRFKNVGEVSPFPLEFEHIAAPNTQLRLVTIIENGVYTRTAGYIPMYVFEEV